MKISISWLKELVDLNCSIEDLVKLLPLRTIGIKEVTDSYIELDMKGYNRADLLSMRGVALEIAAITNSKVKFEDSRPEDYIWSGKDLPPVNMTENDIVASSYCIAKIEGLKVEKSPSQWVKKLNDSGIRSVNNLTDITNLVMLEYGQPLHTFDASSVKKNMGTEFLWDDTTHFTTLDHKPKSLQKGDILIRGDGKIIALGGIMGGENSEVTDNTTSIMLEAAIFDPIQIRKTATRLGFQSEASKRFEHGLTKKRLHQALDAAIKLYQEIGGELTQILLIEHDTDLEKVINLSNDKVRSLIGVDIKDEEIKQYLQRLYFTVKEAEKGWEVTVPYWRLDVNIEEDVIEEVARMYGYEKIPSDKVSESKALQNKDPIFNIIANLRQKLVEIGLTEVQTYSFYSTQIIEALEIKKEKLVKIANPISSETEYLREFLWPNLLEVVGKNIRKGYKDIGIFEIGKAFKIMDGSPKENYRLAIALYNGTDNPLEELYQIAQDSNLHLGGGKLNKALFHPNRQMENLGEIHLRVLNKLGIEKRVAVLEIAITEQQ